MRSIWEKGIVLVCSILALSFAACTTGPGSISGAFKPGTYTAVEKGFGGDVSVTVKVDEGKILSVAAFGPNETAGIGSNAVDRLPALILAAQSANVDGVAGASYSSAAVKAAAAAALAKAKGVQTSAVRPALKMKAGTYTGKAKGYAGTIYVDVTVTDDSLQSIKVVKTVGKPSKVIPSVKDFFYAHYAWAVQDESPQILETVTNVLPGRIVQAQSLSVDTVTGATASSNGVKGAIEDAIRQAGGDPASLYIPIKKKTGTETYNGYDVIVVGAGSSGSMAAAKATEMGAKVLLIEKSGRVGGTGAISSEPCTLGAKIQGDKKYDIDGYYVSLMSRNHWYPKGILVRKFLENTGKTVDWMIDTAQFNFQPENLINPNSPHESDRKFGDCLVGYATDSIATMDAANSWKRLTAKVDTILFETTVKDLILDADGNVTGIVAEKYDGTKIKASAKTVIIATGGFAGNPELMKKYNHDAYRVFGLTQNVGEGLTMMLKAGAVEYNIGGMCAHVTDVAGDVTGFDDFESAIPYTLHAAPSILRVNARGERFASENEKALSMLSSSMYAAAQGSTFYSIVSQSQMDVLARKGVRGTGMNSEIVAVNFHHFNLPIDYKMETINKVMDAGVDAGFIFKSDTLAGLAEAAGMDPETFERHVQRYNAACAAGRDDLFNKSANLLFPLGDKGPYYAVKNQVLVYNSLGGVEVDENMRVLNAQRRTIPNLYAAGVDTIGNILDGVAYPDHLGIAFGWSVNSGRLAGEYAAAASLKK